MICPQSENGLENGSIFGENRSNTMRGNRKHSNPNGIRSTHLQLDDLARVRDQHVVCCGRGGGGRRRLARVARGAVVRRGHEDHGEKDHEAEGTHEREAPDKGPKGAQAALFPPFAPLLVLNIAKSRREREKRMSDAEA